MSRFLRLTFAILFTLAFAAQPAFAQDEAEGAGEDNTEQEEPSAGSGDRPAGLRITGLPLPSYNDDIGFTYGLRVIGTYYEDKYEPYRWQLWGQY
ncbi:MAG: hypothetical protein RIF32_09950, partial [Leptospirales bacterium]